MSARRAAAVLTAGVLTGVVLQQSTGTTLAAFHTGTTASTTVSAATLSPPTGVTGSCLVVLTVSWQAAAGRADGYVVQRSSGGTWSDVSGVLVPGTTSWTSTQLRLLGTWSYRVRTVAGGFSATSAPVSISCSLL